LFATVKIIIPKQVFLASACLILLTSKAIAQGEYQQTRDGKTMVWNGTPKRGETASWNGGRDSENYATGFGALTWYNASGKEYALYYGNMVRGKFDGAVNIHLNGRTAHAYFVDGGRVSTWARGSAPSKAPPALQPVIEKRRVEAEKAKEARAEAARLAATPVPEAVKTKTEPEEVRSTEEHVAAKPVETPTEATPPPVPTENEKAAAATPAQTLEEPRTTPAPAEERNEITSARTEESPTASEQENSQAAPTEQPAASVSQTTDSAATSEKSEADISLNTLVGPPTSLRETTEGSSQTESESPPPEHSGPLTEAEAINLADTEARIHGVPLDNYERPKIDHSNVRGRWSLFYGLKDPSAKSAELEPFTVTVDDKTKKVELRK
jgi:hypothetical protein